MKGKILIISILGLLLVFSACKSDFDVNDKWSDSPVVFCIIDKSQDMQYVKVNKSFIGKLPASEMASVSDSLFYNCDVQVKMHRKQGNAILKTWNFRQVDSIPKESVSRYFGHQSPESLQLEGYWQKPCW